MNIASRGYKTSNLFRKRAVALAYRDAITRNTLAQSETKAAGTTLFEISGQLIH
jgi:hypothetical protein